MSLHTHAHPFLKLKKPSCLTLGHFEVEVVVVMVVVVVVVV